MVPWREIFAIDLKGVVRVRFRMRGIISWASVEWCGDGRGDGARGRGRWVVMFRFVGRGRHVPWTDVKLRDRLVKVKLGESMIYVSMNVMGRARRMYAAVLTTLGVLFGLNCVAEGDWCLWLLSDNLFLCPR